MLGSGKSSGVVNEATNLKANQNLTSAIEEMGTREYLRSRDLDDVVPTHRRKVAERPRDNGVPVYDPAAEKEQMRLERGAVPKGGADRDENDDEDAELMELRRRRVAQLQRQQAKEGEWRQKQHGEFREISQDEFFNIVVREKGGSEDVCVHFYHKDFETCRVVDHRLSELAQRMLSVKFVKLDAEKSPFLVERLHIKTLPCCVLFHHDVAVDRIYGFDGCMTEDGTLDPELLRSRILRAVHPGQEE
ncbi:Thioredoxin domain-containing protein [Trypanosoma conorhini]|uniref:Thioredoxin domain-containing protein n=1 Tax=Trypanosoma conorhini TaxID=83891 RepID=A0A3R7NTC4_9TRYP|nr:Thioredoxin domain-containing protein [Trypanosoma conorhini]RNF07347.1 Thioredoxin domain-containing protein [Trypanosoma conorhini]